MQVWSCMCCIPPAITALSLELECGGGIILVTMQCGGGISLATIQCGEELV